MAQISTSLRNPRLSQSGCIRNLSLYSETENKKLSPREYIAENPMLHLVRRMPVLSTVWSRFRTLRGHPTWPESHVHHRTSSCKERHGQDGILLGVYYLDKNITCLCKIAHWTKTHGLVAFDSRRDPWENKGFAFLFPWWQGHPGM